MELGKFAWLKRPQWEVLNKELEPFPHTVRWSIGFLVRWEHEGVCKRPLKQRLALFVRVAVGRRGSVLGLRMVAGYPPRAVLVPG